LNYTECPPLLGRRGERAKASLSSARDGGGKLLHHEQSKGSGYGRRNGKKGPHDRRSYLEAGESPTAVRAATGLKLWFRPIPSRGGSRTLDHRKGEGVRRGYSRSPRMDRRESWDTTRKAGET